MLYHRCNKTTKVQYEGTHNVHNGTTHSGNGEPQQQYVHAPQRLEPEDVQVDRVCGLYEEFGESRGGLSALFQNADMCSLQHIGHLS